MSTFNGKIIEIPNISVDRFDGENVESIIYFLSHCHRDHMRGLEDWAFQQSLIHKPNVFLYASPISVTILKGLYPLIEPKLKELSLHSSNLIKFPYRDDKCLTVTLLPAGHCPGSVMFLFETDKNILYTGDYRANASDLKKYTAFYSLGQLKKIDKLYLDTTFFTLSFLQLPSRQDSLDNICKIIAEWLEHSEKHIIKIVLSATYGSEFLFISIVKQFRMPIHVNSEIYRLCRHIPEMDKVVTMNGNKTRIHAGCGNSIKNICKSDSSLVRVIKPSALWWQNKSFAEGITCVTKNGDHRVCYSCHASYEEIEEFLMFLKPTEIEPCVVPEKHREKEVMMALLTKTMQLYKEEPKVEEEDVKLFDINYAVGTAGTSSNANKVCVTPEKRGDLLNDILSSPPKTFKRRRL